MKMDLLGKNVVVFGGFGGIGFEICKALINKKISNLAILDLKEDREKTEKLSVISKTTKIIFLEVDVTQNEEVQQQMQKVIESISSIDIVINSCGIINERDPELALRVNLLGIINTTEAAISLMAKKNSGNGGLIVNIASVVGLEPSSNLPIYSATKHGIVGYTRSLGKQELLKESGIKFMTFCPGVTITPLITNIKLKKVLGQKLDMMSKNIKHQSAEECAREMITAIETNKNGSVWICDLGKLTEVNPKIHWELSFSD